MQSLTVYSIGMSLYPYSIEALTLAGILRRGAPLPLAELQRLQDVCALHAARQSRGGAAALEDEIQALLVAALRTDLLAYPSLSGGGIVEVQHCPLGGHRSPREGAVLKRAGAGAGWPDLDVRAVDSLGVRRSILLELKAPEGRASAEQKARIARLRDAGFEAVVAVGLAAACSVLCGMQSGESLLNGALLRR